MPVVKATTLGFSSSPPCFRPKALSPPKDNLRKFHRAPPTIAGVLDLLPRPSSRSGLELTLLPKPRTSFWQVRRFSSSRTLLCSSSSASFTLRFS